MKVILTILFITLSLNVFAQKGFYLKPTVGIGYGGRIHRAELSNIPMDNARGFSYKMLMMAGYGKKRWKFEAGLGYLSQKYGYNGLSLNLDPNVVSKSYANVRYTTNYITLPILAGYSIQVNNRLRFQPQIGLSLNYNMVTKARAEEFDMSGKKIGDVPGIDFKSKTFEIAGNVGLPLIYDLNKKLSIAAGPSFVGFLTQTKRLELFKAIPYALMLDAGLILKL